MQLKRHSAIEAITNICVGYGINFTANMVILPLFGFDISVAQNLFLGTLYTVISLIRSYVLRRVFNRFTG